MVSRVVPGGGEALLSAQDLLGQGYQVRPHSSPMSGESWEQLLLIVTQGRKDLETVVLRL